MEIKTQDGTQSVASAGVGGTALGIGIGALGLSLLQGNGNGLLGGLFGGQNNANCSALMAELAREKSERYADSVGYTAFKESVRLTDALSAKVTEMDKRLSIDEATISSQIACIQNTLSGITKNVVPITSVCPQPMAQYNSWTAPTTTTTTA